MQEAMKKLYEKIEEYEEADEILEYIDDIEDLIERKDYNKEKVIEIETQYSIETKFLLGFDNPEKFGFENNNEDPDLQVLVNLRDRLYLIAVLKILEEEGKEIPRDFAKRNYNQLYELIEN